MPDAADSPEDYFQTNLAYLDALRDLRAATTSLEGNLLSDGLQSSEPPSGAAHQW